MQGIKLETFPWDKILKKKRNNYLEGVRKSEPYCVIC